MNQDDIIRMARETGYYDYLWKTVESGALECFANLIAAAERERIEEAGRSLYEIIGDIKDANSVVIQRNTIRART